MSKARELFAAGELNQAIDTAGAELKVRPSDTAMRTFLFELLCFAGNWDRADRQLDILSDMGPDQRMGALLYRGALSAERTRQEKFSVPMAETKPHPVSGLFNGKAFTSFEDADPRMAGRLEVFAGENYMWIPFEHVSSVTMEAPKRLRDLLWAPAVVRTGPEFHGFNLGPVLLPVLSPFSWRHADPRVRLGRLTVWEESEAGEHPFGQKMWLVDGEEVPLLDLRNLEFPSLEDENSRAD